MNFKPPTPPGRFAFTAALFYLTYVVLFVVVTSVVAAVSRTIRGHHSDLSDLFLSLLTAGPVAVIIYLLPAAANALIAGFLLRHPVLPRRRSFLPLNILLGCALLFLAFYVPLYLQSRAPSPTALNSMPPLSAPESLVLIFAILLPAYVIQILASLATWQILRRLGWPTHSDQADPIKLSPFPL